MNSGAGDAENMDMLGPARIRHSGPDRSASASVARLQSRLPAPSALAPASYSAPPTRYALALLVALLSISGCSGNRQLAPPAPAELVQPSPRFGLASYYGRAFQGRVTASGERYDADKLTAAHRTLPFGTRLRVTNLANGRNVVVRVNDRGPNRAERLIDLSLQAARKLQFGHQGLTRVRVEIL